MSASVDSSYRNNTTGVNFVITKYTGSSDVTNASQTFSGGTTGDGPTGIDFTVEFAIAKNRDDDSTDWVVYHKDCTASNKHLKLNTTGGEFTATADYPLIEPNVGSSGTNITVRNNSTAATNLNELDKNYILYSWGGGETAKFGSYTGMGTATQGPFVYLGFKPSLLIIHNTTGSNLTYNSWLMLDGQRSTYNVRDDTLWANLTAVEDKRGNGSSAVSDYVNIDFLSNGFTIINTSGSNSAETRESGSLFVYAAFAESPFKFNTGA